MFPVHFMCVFVCYYRIVCHSVGVEVRVQLVGVNSSLLSTESCIYPLIHFIVPKVTLTHSLKKDSIILPYPCYYSEFWKHGFLYIHMVENHLYFFLITAN